MFLVANKDIRNIEPESSCHEQSRIIVYACEWVCELFSIPSYHFPKESLGLSVPNERFVYSLVNTINVETNEKALQ